MFPASADYNNAPTSPRTSHRRGVLAALLCVGILLAVAVPTTAADAKKVPKGFFGLAQGGPADAKDYAQMNKIKVRSFRLPISWYAVEPRPGVFNWAQVDNQVGVLASHGITPVITIWGSPAWATGAAYPGVPPLKGKAKRGWKIFLKAAVDRYQKGGEYWTTHPSVPKKPVKFWQIWNEPNLPKYFSKAGTNPPKSYPKTAKSYAKLVKTSDKAIQNADKHAKVVLAGLSSSSKKKKNRPTAFIEKFLKTKAVRKHFAAAALHPYAPSIGKYESRISKFRKAMKKGGAKRKPLWLTEVGWGSKKSHKSSLSVGKKKQGKLLKQSFKLTLKNRKKWKIDRLFWFDWRDPPSSQPGCSFCNSAGLLKNNRKPKPAYRQFRHFTKLQGKKGGHHHHHHGGHHHRHHHHHH